MPAEQPGAGPGAAVLLLLPGVPGGVRHHSHQNCHQGECPGSTWDIICWHGGLQARKIWFKSKGNNYFSILNCKVGHRQTPFFGEKEFFSNIIISDPHLKFLEVCLNSESFWWRSPIYILHWMDPKNAIFGQCRSCRHFAKLRQIQYGISQHTFTNVNAFIHCKGGHANFFC